MSGKGIEDLLNEYSSDESEEEPGLRNSAVDRLLEFEDDDDEDEDNKMGVGSKGVHHSRYEDGGFGKEDAAKDAKELSDRVGGEVDSFQ